MSHVIYWMAIIVLMTGMFQLGADYGKSQANGICKLVCYEDGKAR